MTFACAFGSKDAPGRDVVDGCSVAGFRPSAARVLRRGAPAAAARLPAALALVVGGALALAPAPAAAQSYQQTPTYTQAPAYIQAPTYTQAPAPAPSYPQPSAPGAAMPVGTPAPAPMAPLSSFSNLVSEFRIGALDHDIGFLTHHVENGVDVNLEVLFDSPAFLAAIGSPRPDIGADINTDGNTSDGYLGLTWTYTLVHDLFGTGKSVFIDGSLGGAYQDGYVDSAPPGRKRLGSPILFHLSADFGVQLTPTVSVMALLDHISNADLGQHNAGITSAGIRLGFKF